MSHIVTCSISWENFIVSDHEVWLREKFWFSNLPETKPKYRLRHLGAFYPNWAFYKRKCDKTEKDIISIFSPDCPYPVWDRDEWFKFANPPYTDIDFSQSFFPQAQKLFYQCPIPHIFHFQCENCAYADDWYESRDCYLCHGGTSAEGLRYCARMNNGCKDSIYCTSCVSSQWCYDCTNCENAYYCVHCLDVRNSRNCMMSFDCRNCQDCLFCFNLRGKQYCVGNRELTKEQYESERAKWKLETRTWYQKAQTYFAKMMHEIAWLRSTYVELSEETTWNYVQHMKDCEMCFMELDHENCCHGLWSGWGVKHICEGLGTYGCHGGYKVTMPIKCFEIRFSFMCFECRFSDYLAYCVGCENCIGCAWLHKKNYCIFNKPYSKQEFAELQKRLIDHMKSTGEWGQFFPGDFAPNVYEDSLSAAFWPLTRDMPNISWFRMLQNPHVKLDSYLSSDTISESSFEADEWVTKQIYWDKIARKPFTILSQDINFCRTLFVPLPDTHYIRRILHNLSWMPFNGELRTTKCAKSGKEIQTSWPAEYDGRILSEEEYLRVVV